MAGTNKVLKDGQILFKAGDKSDGMFLIRRGEVRVYLEKDGKEVVLATVGEGGMIGEMALFDNQPRSASVKASKECEVTLISQEDFTKLMKQIPKWFVGLMSALSSRLRQTNERLKNLESSGAIAAAPPASAASEPAKKASPYQTVLRQLHIIVLIFHKDGEKDGKDWIVAKAPLESTLIELFQENAEKLREMLSVLIKNKFITLRQDSYKNAVLALSNRGALAALASFITQFVKGNAAHPFLSDDAVNIIKILERLVLASPYDAATVSLADLVKEGKREGKNTIAWDQEILTLTKAGEEVKVVKTSTGPGLKGQKKDVATFALHCQVLAALHKANLQ